LVRFVLFSNFVSNNYLCVIFHEVLVSDWLNPYLRCVRADCSFITITILPSLVKYHKCLSSDWPKVRVGFSSADFRSSREIIL
jgi:hypothetical protein